jgi:Tfp pilus assembly protein PilO
MPPIKISKREKNLAIMTLSALVFYVFYQFLLLPLWDEVARLNTKAQKARMELKIAEGKVGVLESLQKHLVASPEEGQGPASALDEPLSGKTKGERALYTLRSIAGATSKSRLNLILIRPMIGEGEGQRFGLTCSGSYRELYDFLRILGGLKILVLVDSLNVSGGGVTKPSLGVEMTLTAYF